MAALGINFDLRADRDWQADLGRIRQSGAQWIRMPLRMDTDIEGFCAVAQGMGLKVLGVYDSLSHQHGIRVWASAAPYLDAWQTGNEPDGSGPSSWSMSKDEFMLLLANAEANIHGIPLIAGGLVSGDTGWLDGVDLGRHQLAVHPYGRFAQENPRPAWYFGSVEALLDRYRAKRPGVPLWVTEWGAPVSDFSSWSPVSQEARGIYYGAMARALAAYPAEAAITFCWAGWMVEGFGLLTKQDLPLRAYEEFLEVAQSQGDSMATLEERIALLEKQQALTVDLAARILSGKWDQGAESAEALLQAIAPVKYGQFQAVPFPKA